MWYFIFSRKFSPDILWRYLNDVSVLYYKNSECLEVMVKLAESLRDRGFVDLQFIDLGGGLGIDYRKHVSSFNVVNLASKPKAYLMFKSLLLHFKRRVDFLRV
jgi:hypothetical protein